MQEHVWMQLFPESEYIYISPPFWFVQKLYGTHIVLFKTTLSEYFTGAHKTS